MLDDLLFCLPIPIPPVCGGNSTLNFNISWISYLFHQPLDSPLLQVPSPQDPVLDCFPRRNISSSVRISEDTTCPQGGVARDSVQFSLPPNIVRKCVDGLSATDEILRPYFELVFIFLKGKRTTQRRRRLKWRDLALFTSMFWIWFSGPVGSSLWESLPALVWIWLERCCMS